MESLIHNLKYRFFALHIKYYYCMLVALDFEMTN